MAIGYCNVNNFYFIFLFTFQRFDLIPAKNVQAYLKIGQGDFVLHVLAGFLHGNKKIIECASHDARVIVCPQHCVGLTSTCGTKYDIIC